MHEIDKDRFGAFVAQLRREKGMTQRELADRLYTQEELDEMLEEEGQ